jgi:hypothetical protein
LLRFAVAEGRELFEELFLFVGEVLRELADETNVFVAAASCAHVRDTATG